MVALLAHVRSSVVGASVRLLTAIVALMLTFVLSLFLYGSLYYSWIPPSYSELPLHFVKRTSVAETSLSKRDEQPPPRNASALADGAAAAAADRFAGDSGTGSLVAELDAYVSAGGAPPLALFAPGHAYAVTVEFQLPESEGNVALGTFTLAARSYDARGELLQTAARMLRLRYRSWLLRALDTLLFAPLYLLGEREQKQTLGVELFAEYRENAYRPTARLVLELSDGRVELYAAQLRVRVSLVGLSYWMFHWPLVSAVVGVASFESFLLVVLVSSWLARSRRRRRAAAVPADTQIASATNLPAVGAAESVSSQSPAAAADAAAAAAIATGHDPSAVEDYCGARGDDGIGEERRREVAACALAEGDGGELRRRRQRHS